MNRWVKQFLLCLLAGLCVMGTGCGPEEPTPLPSASEEPAPLPPEVVETYLSNVFVPDSEPVTLRVKTRDPQDSALSFSWEANTGTLATPTHGANSSEILWTAPACIPTNTPPTITITVTNALGLSASATFSISGGKPCGWVATNTVAVGDTHTVVLKEDGTVWTSGHNSQGQLGDGTTTNYSVPVQVQGLSHVTAIAAGWVHSVALKDDGTVWAWGRNNWGGLGDGTTTDRYVPVQVQGLSRITALAAGQGHSVALKEDGTVWAWGYNQAGALGDGSRTNRMTPVQVKGLSRIIAIAAGPEHNVALRRDGTVWTWGRNDWGQIGNGTVRVLHLTPVQVPDLTQVTAVAAGFTHTLAVKAGGTVWAWGHNNEGQLGDGTTESRSVPVQVAGLTQVTSLIANSNHTVVLRKDGTVWDWGYNIAGQPSVRTRPVQVPGLTRVSALAPGGSANHTVVRKTDGTIWGWGSNEYGQLGDGTQTRRSAPVRMTHLDLP
ncbi:RCC1 repeat-containing protein [Archangium sp.]|jgi:alpha-tubulin suppressor-like RCC1 family protein|uniref:RCC1 domain-containing protein n=1 Tax=Archangium sp. TaxID=1872627 RepID=UPI002EDAB667